MIPPELFTAIQEQLGLKLESQKGPEAAAVKVSDFEGDVIHITRRIYDGEVGDVKSKKAVRALPVSGELKERMLQIAGSEWIFIF